MSGAQLPQSLPHVKRVAQIELIALGFIELPHYKLLFVIQWPRSQAEVRGRILGNVIFLCLAFRDTFSCRRMKATGPH